MFHFIHAADVHLDSPLIGLERYGDAPIEEIRGATRRAFENLVELALKEDAAFLILAGDLYDGDWKDYNTGIFIARQMARLKEANIRVFIAAGNHDAASQITRSLKLPDNVHLFSHRKAESILLPELNVVVHGRGFAERVVPDDISQQYPPARSGSFNIGVLHTSMNGREGHDVYAPCSIDGLKTKGYQYWALGHVHKHEVASRDPWIIYPGNLQGRHIRETGPKGCVIVHVEDGEVRSMRHEPVDVLRWSEVEVAAAGTKDPLEVINLAAQALDQEWTKHGGMPVVIRLRISGTSAAHDTFRAYPEHWAAQFRAIAQEYGQGQLWIEKILFNTQPAVDTGDWSGDEAIATIIKELRMLATDPSQVAGLLDDLNQLKQKLPPDLLLGPDSADPTEPQTMDSILSEARDLIEARLLRGGMQP
ncbi:MAG TPA: DNA repair exonuclease [Syntrophales bacterium]|jgi:DNA repair exonuclease SbcCD nuclease subunit|nr:DNA repair exonuclease [Syntrophales bacterium]HPL66970.1 DNA repair exonuclease [Smithellaceae bacterium]HQG34530.1 DNA repair exonuclease [Syntrophales bacterium]HQI36144.1 DNA repair exonuclease [Syntrophales bacterium]HRR47864.1 DNA repair exonuclease [Syntrophales bacterium]